MGNFFSSRGSGRIFKGSHQMPWISTLSEGKNPDFSGPTKLDVACRVIHVLHFTAAEWSSYQNIDRAVSCNLCNFCTYFFYAGPAVTHRTKLWCDVVILDLYAYSSNLVHLGDALVASLVHIAAVQHVRDAHLCIIINTGNLGCVHKTDPISVLWTYPK